MLASFIGKQLFAHLSADRILGKHTFNSLLKSKIALFSHQFVVSYLFETADITGVITVILLALFTTRQSNLVGIDDYYVIAGINVGRENRLILSS